MNHSGMRLLDKASSRRRFIPYKHDCLHWSPIRFDADNNQIIDRNGNNVALKQGLCASAIIGATISFTDLSGVTITELLTDTAVFTVSGNNLECATAGKIFGITLSDGTIIVPTTSFFDVSGGENHPTTTSNITFGERDDDSTFYPEKYGLAVKQFLANPTFQFTGLTLVDWTLLGTNANNYIEENANGVRFVADGASAFGIYQTALTADLTYKITLDIYSITGSFKISMGSETFINSTGTHVYFLKSTSTANFFLYRAATVACDAVIKSCTVEILYPRLLDDSGFAGSPATPFNEYEGLIKSKGIIDIDAQSHLGTLFDFEQSPNTAIEAAGLDITDMDGTDCNADLITTAETELDTSYPHALTASVLNRESMKRYAGDSNIGERFFTRISNISMMSDMSVRADGGKIHDILLYNRDLSEHEQTIVEAFCRQNFLVDECLRITATTTGASESVVLARLKLSETSTIYWGDGDSTSLTGGTQYDNLTHTYTTAGSYSVRVAKADKVTEIAITNNKWSNFNSYDLRNAVVNYFSINFTGSGFVVDSSHMTGWTSTSWNLYAMPSGTYNINTSHMTGWDGYSWNLFSMPSGTYNINTSHMTGWVGSNWRLYSMPSGTYNLDSSHMTGWIGIYWYLLDMPSGSYTISDNVFQNWLVVKDIRIYNLIDSGTGLNVITETIMNQIIDDIYDGRLTFTYGTPSLIATGTNAAPTGTALTQIGHLRAGDDGVDTFNAWSINVN